MRKIQGSVQELKSAEYEQTIFGKMKINLTLEKKMAADIIGLYCEYLAVGLLSEKTSRYILVGFY